MSIANQPATPCDALAAMLDDLVEWSAELPLTSFGDQFHGVIVRLAHDLMREECGEPAT
jgi:hypothetical protein